MSLLVPWQTSPLEIPVDIDRLEAQRRALAELAKAKYGGTPEFLEQTFDWLLEWLTRIDEWLAGLGGVPGSGVSPGFLIAVGLLLAAIIVVVWRVGWPKWRRRTRVTPDLELNRSLSADDYRTRAQASAAAGDWRAAVGDRFRAVVRELEVRTVLDVRPARTAWEAARSAVRLLPDRQADLYAGADLFSAVSYGDQTADTATYSTMIGIDDRVTAAADAVDLAEEPVASVPAPGIRR